jgi:hypothetical protein
MHVALIRRALVAGAALFAASAIAQPPPEQSTPEQPPSEAPAPDPIGDLIDSVPIAPRPPAAVKPSTLEGYLSSLRSRSCPAGIEPVEAEAIGLKAKSVSLQAINPMRTSVGRLSLVAGYHLTSDDKRFGGLSGIDSLDNGNLIAISDMGDFVWIDLQDDGLTPSALRIAPMRDRKGKPFPTKIAADAEGLAVRDGLALVSFESDPRVLAYDIGACGAAARGIALGWSMDSAFANRKLTVANNQGVEGLAISDDWYLLAGIETKVGKSSPLSARPLEAGARFELAIGENAPELVGLDVVQIGDEVHVFSLHRSSKALSGNAITVVETVLDRSFNEASLPARMIGELERRSRQEFQVKSSRVLAEMNLLVTIDNYEGIAALRMPDGRTRLFIVSDDNFSASQRTLLMVFDVK